MKTTILILCVSLTTCFSFAQSETASLDPTEVRVISNVEKKASSTADAEALYVEATTIAKVQLSDFINQEVAYPEAFRGHYLEGTVVVDFWIDHNGKIVQTKVMKGISDAFDKAVLEKIEKLQALRLNSVEYLGASRIRIPIDFSMY
jgi:TonB family protein